MKALLCCAVDLFISLSMTRRMEDCLIMATELAPSYKPSKRDLCLLRFVRRILILYDHRDDPLFIMIPKTGPYLASVVIPYASRRRCLLLVFFEADTH